ncbi:hypothetical protein [Bradyrhizobium sp. USDA 10063]
MIVASAMNEPIAKTGWMVTIAIVKNGGKIGHEMYAVAIAEPGQAVKVALKAGGGEAAVVNGVIDDASMKSLKLKSGEVLKILNDESDPLTSGTTRH